MTQINENPQLNSDPQTVGQSSTGAVVDQHFKPIVPDPIQCKLSRKPLIILGAAVCISILGAIFSVGKPDTAKAKPPVAPDVSKMTVKELAENAGIMATRELVRLMVQGTPAEQVAVSNIMCTSRNPRLGRNMAIAMMAEQRKKQHEIMRQMMINRQKMMDYQD